MILLGQEETTKKKEKAVAQVSNRKSSLGPSPRFRKRFTPIDT
jgi:hypothetical protein